MYGESLIISNLHISNEASILGLSITAFKPGANHGIMVTDCRFTDINTGFGYTGYDSGGITILADGRRANWFDNVRVENNTFDRVARCAVYISSNWAARRGNQGWGDKNTYVSDADGWYPNRGVVVRGNRMTGTGGDAILLIGADGALIEYNTVLGSGLFRNTGSTIHYASIWVHSANDCIIQYNEVGGNRADNNAADMQAFDADISCKNIVFQYNYSHDNAGGFLLVCADGIANRGETIGTVARYNLSINDGSAGYALAVITLTGEAIDTYIYNNTIYMGIPTKLLTTAAWSGYGSSSGTVFTNNIFSACPADGVGYLVQSITDAFFINNLFHNVQTPVDSRITVTGILNADPQFLSAGKTGYGREFVGRYYQSAVGSPALSGGLPINNYGGLDYFGKASDGAFYGAIAP